MKLLVPAILFVLCSAALSAGQSFDEDPQNTTTTERPTTQPPPPTTTTAVPTTHSTTEPPTTTTEPPTTKTPPVTTTTEVPTSSGAPITTEAPRKICTFNVTQGNTTCIKAEMIADFLIPMMHNDVTLHLDCDSQWEQSDCFLSNDTQKLVLVKPEEYTLTMIFEKQDKTVSLSNISFAYFLPNATGDVANNSGNLLKMKAGNSYMCKSEIEIPLQNVTMKITDLHIQAFIEKSNEFGTAEECDADDKVSDIVPIAVGVALGALIIIVLIAYLVGRRRSRQKGYQSV